jgi:hypothetical protein
MMNPRLHWFWRLSIAVSVVLPLAVLVEYLDWPHSSPGRMGRIEYALAFWMGHPTAHATVHVLGWALIAWFAYGVVTFYCLPGRRPEQQARCPRCGRDLAGSVTGRCPECGAPT